MQVGYNSMHHVAEHDVQHPIDLLPPFASDVLMECSMLVEGSELNIEIHKEHSRHRKILILERTPKEELMCKARIMFDDLWKCTSSGTGRNCKRICTSMTPDLLRGRQQTPR